MIKRPPKYVPNLQKMQAVCTRNYALLLRLLPIEYKQDASWDIKCDEQLEFRLKIIDQWTLWQFQKFNYGYVASNASVEVENSKMSA